MSVFFYALNLKKDEIAKFLHFLNKNALGFRKSL